MCFSYIRLNLLPDHCRVFGRRTCATWLVQLIDILNLWFNCYKINLFQYRPRYSFQQTYRRRMREMCSGLLVIQECKEKLFLLKISDKINAGSAINLRYVPKSKPSAGRPAPVSRVTVGQLPPPTRAHHAHYRCSLPRF